MTTDEVRMNADFVRARIMAVQGTLNIRDALSGEHINTGRAIATAERLLAAPLPPPAGKVIQWPKSQVTIRLGERLLSSEPPQTKTSKPQTAKRRKP